MQSSRLLIALLAVLPGAGWTADAPADTPVGKLGTGVRPLHYRLDLQILPDQPGFSGVAEIDIDITAPTQVIWLHGNELVVSEATFSPESGASLTASYEQVDPTGVVRLTFAQAIAAGRGTLRFVYAATYSRAGEGLYRAVVDDDSYAFTQFEPIDARRMFPGFDEPGFKTPFDIAVTTRATNSVVGNAPVRVERPAGEGLKRVEFVTTLPLPTYLIALAAGPLDIVDAPPLPPNAVRKQPLPLRAVTTRGKGARMRYALDNTNAIVSYLEGYFGIPFPYPKLDLIASPNADGAMENAGAIIYDEQRFMLADDASFERRRDFGDLHAHENAHQWFGDLVTPKWWDDVWLNESFANWMGSKAGKVWKPTLRFEVVPVVEMLVAMDQDSRIAARQIRNPVTRNADINSAFDGITYLKGASVLGMFENWLGEDAFRAGIRRHMQRFPYSVANVDDFMASLAEGSGRPDVVPAFRSFIDQAGVPLVTVHLECGDKGATLAISQSRYLPVGSRGDPQRAWQLPLCVRYGSTAGTTKKCLLLKDGQARMPLKARGCPTFVMPNADGTGYYRFALDTAGWSALMANFSQLNEIEAFAAADSLSAAYQANRLSTDAYLAAVTTLIKVGYPQVAMAPGKSLVRLRDYLAPAAERQAVIDFMRAAYRPRLDALGDDPTVATANSAASAAADAATVDRAMFRAKLVRYLALEARDPELRARLAEQASRYIGFDATGKGAVLSPDMTAVNPALVDVALPVGVQEFGAPFVEALIARLLASNDSQFRSQVAAALGSTDDPVVAERVRKLLLDPQLRAREPTTIAFALAARPSQRRATFDWFKANHEGFISRIPRFGYRWLPNFGSGFCTQAEHDEVQAFFTPLLGQLDGAERTLAETLESIELCTALVEAKREEVGLYFSLQGDR